MKKSKNLMVVAMVVLLAGVLTPTFGDVAAYWKFDENTGTSASDSSTNSNTGALLPNPGTPASWVPGKWNSALNFDGTEDVVNVSSHSSLNFTTAFTIETFIKPDSSGGAGAIIARKNYAYNFGFNESDMRAFQFHIRSNGGGWISLYCSNPTALPTDSWTHVAVTYDNSLADKNMKVYVNGTVIGTHDTTVTLWSTANRRLALGAGHNDSAYYGFFKGGIDEVRLSNTALSAPEMLPEPATMTLLGLGGIGLLVRRRRKRA
ncbi:MAG: LamG domain-containing protein [Phycisphaerae bacterium]|nr:LamG domain-containing protein [Phycisphaerae bacterium]